MKKTTLSLALAGALTLNGGVMAEDLMEVYGIALENDAQLSAARAARDAQKLAEPLARTTFRPMVSLSGGASANRGDDTTTMNYSAANIGVNLSQTLYDKQADLRLSQAGDQALQADTQYSGEEQALIVRVARAYFDILAAQDNLTFVQAQNAAIDRQLDQAKQRFDVGLIAITAVHEAQAVSDQARADLILAENELDNTREGLREILASDVARISPLVAAIPLEPPTPADIGHWGEIALENNLGILAARQGLEMARKEIEVQRAARSPQVDLVGSHTYSRSDGDYDSDAHDTRIGLQLSMPLWLGGSVPLSTDQSRLRFEQAREALEQQRRSVARQVRDAYRGVLSGISTVRALEAGVVSAQSALEATKAGFEVGTRTMVDVLNAERDLYSVKSKHAAARYQYVVAGLQLRQAAGTLGPQDLAKVNGWLE